MESKFQREKERLQIDTNKNDTILNKILVGVAISIGGTAIPSAAKVIKNLSNSVLDVGEWDNSYNNINKMVYKMNPKMYIKHRAPTTNKDFFELCEDTTYLIKLKNKNYIKIETYRNKSEKTYYPEHRLKVRFYGSDKYRIREDFMKNALRLTDEKHIRVQYLNEYEMSCDVIPHCFDNIVLSKGVKSRIINGLQCWRDSKEWYDSHQLVHKIGVFLYGKPGTGKSTIAKAVSTMFKNAPILTIDPINIMKSIDSIMKMRKKYDGTIIVLIEDFDMYFKSREELEQMDLNIGQKKQKDINQNAIFQLLDGVYSTDNTIYIATTNYKDRIDSALIRHGRFDIQEELDYFSHNDAIKCVRLLGYDENVLSKLDIKYPVQPAYLQSKVMEYRSNELVK